MNKLDYKKEYKDLYMPKTKPVFIDVPPIHYVMVEGTSMNTGFVLGIYKSLYSFL